MSRWDVGVLVSAEPDYRRLRVKFSERFGPLEKANCFFYISNFEDIEKGGIVPLIVRTAYSAFCRTCSCKAVIEHVVNPLGPFLPKCD